DWVGLTRPYIVSSPSGLTTKVRKLWHPVGWFFHCAVNFIPFMIFLKEILIPLPHAHSLRKPERELTNSDLSPATLGDVPGIGGLILRSPMRIRGIRGPFGPPGEDNTDGPPNEQYSCPPALLLDTDRVQFGPANSLNPATLLPVPGDPVPHDCQQILAETHGTRLDLTDQPQGGADLTWYTDGVVTYSKKKERPGPQ
ncbi:hypothetical protein STEG23_035504, partial [Scotinomys teguina]